MLGLCLALPAPLPPDLIACILARILGHAGEKVGKDINGDIPSSPANPWVLSFATPPVKEKSMDGHRFFLASDAALQSIEVLVKEKTQPDLTSAFFAWKATRSPSPSSVDSCG